VGYLSWYNLSLLNVPQHYHYSNVKATSVSAADLTFEVNSDWLLESYFPSHARAHTKASSKGNEGKLVNDNKGREI